MGGLHYFVKISYRNIGGYKRGRVEEKQGEMFLAALKHHIGQAMVNNEEVRIYVPDSENLLLHSATYINYEYRPKGMTHMDEYVEVRKMYVGRFQHTKSLAKGEVSGIIVLPHEGDGYIEELHVRLSQPNNNLYKIIDLDSQAIDYIHNCVHIKFDLHTYKRGAYNNTQNHTQNTSNTTHQNTQHSQNTSNTPPQDLRNLTINKEEGQFRNLGNITQQDIQDLRSWKYFKS